MSDQQYFSLAESNELIPWLKDKLEEIYTLAFNVTPDSGSRILKRGLTSKIHTNGTSKSVDHLSGLQKDKEKVEKEIEGILGDIKEKGIILRNIENGLSDFPSVKEGEDIFYCWTAEETQIQYWHYRYEGYSGRKPI